MNGFERKADWSNPNRISCRRDVFSISCIPFSEPFLHVGEVLIDVVVLMPLGARFSTSSAPSHEQNRFRALGFDFVAEGHGGIFALLPNRVVGRQGRYLALVLEDDEVPRVVAQGSVPLVARGVEVLPVVIQHQAAAGKRRDGSVVATCIDHGFNQRG